MRSSHSFYLNGRSLYVQYYAPGILPKGRLQEPTGLVVDAKQFKLGKRTRGQQAVMNRITTVLDHYEEHCNVIGKMASNDEVVALIVEATGRSKARPRGLSLLDYSRLYLGECAAGRIIKEDGKKYSASYVELGNAIVKKLGKSPVGSLPLGAVGVPQLRAFAAFLVAEGQSQNTVATYSNSLLGYIRQGKKSGLHNSVDIGEGARVQLEELEHHVYLTEEDQQALARLDIEPELRDAFLLGCQLGMRHSDFVRLTPMHRQGDAVNINTQKTGKAVWVPLSPLAIELWEKCNGQPAAPHDSDVMARGIRRLGEAAGLNADVLFSRTEGGIKIERWKKKWELMSTHTMRRSFATNAMKAGVPILSIMKVTGHKTIDAFMRYIRVSDEEHARTLAEHPHFK